MTVELDRHTMRVAYEGQSFRCTKSEFAVCQALSEHPGHILSRAQLLDAIDPTKANEVYERVIDQHVKRVRNKMRNVFGFHCIEAINGVGYAWRQRTH